MNQELIVSLILLGPVAITILFITLYIFFKKSILFKIGTVTGLFGIYFGLVTSIVSRLGQIHYIWSIPLTLVALLVAFRYLKYAVKDPLVEINNVFNFLQTGDIKSTQYLKRESDDEFGGISISANKLIKGFLDMATFAQEIGRGNLDSKYEVLGKKDILGNSLIEMQQNLKVARNEEDKRKGEEKKRFWTNEGFAKFGDILRNNDEDNENFYYSIISNLVKYVGAKQGGLFLINDDDEQDKYIELVGMYAYERRKYTNKRIEIGETLVGQCVLEGESIYMTDIPQDYIRVTSGLGDANPTSLILVPLRFNEQVYGVIELAAFTEFDDYKKQFIEKVGETIASTISTYKVNLKTVQLLEESKVQSEELAAQEEEIRQNMEELQTTQEESDRRESEMKNLLDALNASTLVVELDLTGSIVRTNDNYAKLIESSSANMLGSSWLNFIQENEGDDFADILRTVQDGIVYKREVKLKNNIKISETYSLVNDATGFPFKILNVGLQIG